MTDQITKLLDDVQRLDQSAQPGPWMHNGTEGEVGVILGAPVKFGSFEEYPQITGFVEGEVDNGEFIALSRTAMPTMGKALRAVLELHKTRVHDEDPTSPFCNFCGPGTPCETTRAITDALGANHA